MRAIFGASKDGVRRVLARAQLVEGAVGQRALGGEQPARVGGQSDEHEEEWETETTRVG